MPSYDKAYRHLFSLREVVIDLLFSVLPPEWLAQLAMNALERVNGSLVASNLKGLEADCVWRTRSLRTGRFTYFVIEFQRTNEAHMMLRFLGYNVALFVQHQESKSQAADSLDSGLPCMVNLLIYHGITKWTGPQTVKELLPPLPQSKPEWMGPFGYLLVDMSAKLDLDPNTLFSHLKSVESARSLEEFQWALSRLTRRLRQGQEEHLQRAIVTWLREILSDRLVPGVELPEINDIFTMESLLESNISSWVKQWKQEGRQEGRQEGLRDGEVAVLERQLNKRFGPLPKEIHLKLRNASTAQLEHWADNFVFAKTLDEVFDSCE